MYARFKRAPEGQQTAFEHMKSVGSEVEPFARFMQGATFMYDRKWFDRDRFPKVLRRSKRAGYQTRG